MVVSGKTAGQRSSGRPGEGFTYPDPSLRPVGPF